MDGMLETPSRVWRRIEAIEGREIPSLPSLPAFEEEDSNDLNDNGLHTETSDSEMLDEDMLKVRSPLQSTPAASTAHQTAVSSIHPPSSTASTARFASSIASRSTKLNSALSASNTRRNAPRRGGQNESFNVSLIPPPPDHSDDQASEDEFSVETRPIRMGALNRPNASPRRIEELDDSLSDGLGPLSPPSSPYASARSIAHGITPKKSFDYSTNLKSEPKASPLDKYRHVALRRSRNAAPVVSRTPSLTRTTPSPNSSLSHSTPHSTKSAAFPSPRNSPNPYAVPLPRSNTGSPAVLPDRPGSGSDQDEEPSLPESEIEDLDISDPQQNAAYGQSHRSDYHSDQFIGSLRGPAGEASNASEQEHEPTFSSEGDQSQRTVARASPAPRNLSSFSSPAQSVAATPTPTYYRRARFAGLSSDQSDEVQNGDTQDLIQEDPLTPHARRRSFLLSVINSTTRPRMKAPTPHPKITIQEDSMEVNLDSTPRQANGPSRVNLQTALAGVTPRPRAGFSKQPRPSHPLANTVVPSPESSRTDSILDSSPGTPGLQSNSRASARRSSLGNTVPASGYLSPYDGANDKASFISTASSHDLTTHHRVNTSFDPSMGFGNGAGQGVGRFNANKLNNYLHGLNRRLQEENEILLERLRKAEEAQQGAGEVSPSAGSERSGRRSSGGRRVSVGGSNLDNVEEGQGWLEEKAELEEMVDALNGDLARMGQVKEELEDALKEELEEKERSKQRWKERMVEIEQSVAGIISDLELKLKNAEERVVKAEEERDRHRDDEDFEVIQLKAELDAATKRYQAAEHALENRDDLGGELKQANERVGHVMADLRNANAHIKDLESELGHAEDRAHNLEKEIHDNRDTIDRLEQQLQAKEEQVDSGRSLRENEELEHLRAEVEELEEGAVSTVARIDELEHDLACANAEVEAAQVSEAASQDRAHELEIKAQNAHELARQMEEALEEAERKMAADEEALREFRTKVASLERDRQRGASIHETSRNPFMDGNGPSEADVEALEKELDDANKEIARLTTLVNQSPARKAVEKARDAKVELLEREREELLERNKALRLAMNEIHTPHKMINASGISPMHKQVLAMSIRAPKTPGGPLKDLSWLNATSIDPTVSPLVVEIQRLQRELDEANESIDDKIDKLEEAGLGVVGLTQKLEDARSKISALEDEIARLSRREERRLRVLERAKCKKCQIKVNLDDSMDLSHDSFGDEPQALSRTSDGLRAELQATNADLVAMKNKWDEEREKLREENAVLRDATHRLSTEVRHVKAETRRAGDAVQTEATGIQGELNKALQLVADLEADLKSERARLRTMSSEQDHVQKERAQVLRQLQRTTSDMEDVKEQLQRYKSENQALEKEMGEANTAEQKARLLEAKVVENAETIDQLRHERSHLAADHKNLQKKYSEMSEQANRLRQRYDVSSTSHDERRHQLDLHLLEITDLKRALATQSDELGRAQDENDRIAAERKDVARLVGDLEADLRRVKKDAEAFQRDLRLLRTEKDRQERRYEEELGKLERSKKQTQTQLRLLNEELDIQRARISQAKDELENHVCHGNGVDERQMVALKAKHNKECKGLLVNIKYLKAKFTRESEMRFRLSYQKHYLVVLLAQFEKSERTIFAAIARVGFGTPLAVKPAPKKPKKLKSAVLAVIFLSRAARESKAWREQRAFKTDVVAALENVRRRRAIGGSDGWPH